MYDKITQNPCYSFSSKVNYLFILPVPHAHKYISQGRVVTPQQDVSRVVLGVVLYYIHEMYYINYTHHAA